MHAAVTLAWILACVVFAVIARHRPYIGPFAVFALYVLVPVQTDGYLTAVLSPAEFMLLALAFITWSEAPGKFFAEFRRLRWVVATYVVTTALMIIGVLSVGKSLLNALKYSLTMLALPILFSVLVIRSLRDSRALRFYVGALYALVGFEVVLAWVQYNTGRPIFWGNYFEQQWWWGEDFTITQPVGTFGHWIPLSTFLASSLPLITLVKNRLLWAAAILAVTMTVVVTAARTGLIILAIALVVIIVRGFTVKRAGAALATAVGTGVVAFIAQSILSTSQIADVLTGKFEDDGRSTELRLEAAEWFWAHSGEYLLGAYAGDADLRGNGTLGSSFENAFYMFGFAFGIIAAALVLLVMIIAMLATLRSHGTYRWGMALTAAGLMVSMFTSGSWGTGAMGEMMSFCLLLAIGATVNLKPTAPLSPEPETDPSVADLGDYVAKPAPALP